MSDKVKRYLAYGMNKKKRGDEIMLSQKDADRLDASGMTLKDKPKEPAKEKEKKSKS